MQSVSSKTAPISLNNSFFKLHYSTIRSWTLISLHYQGRLFFGCFHPFFLSLSLYTYTYVFIKNISTVLRKRRKKFDNERTLFISTWMPLPAKLMRHVRARYFSTPHAEKKDSSIVAKNFFSNTFRSSVKIMTRKGRLNCTTRTLNWERWLTLSQWREKWYERDWNFDSIEIRLKSYE